MNSTNHLSICEVITDQFRIVGSLYFKTECVLILLNNILSEIDLGPMKPVVDKQLSPEVDIYILPTDKINKIVEYEAGTA